MAGKKNAEEQEVEAPKKVSLENVHRQDSLKAILQQILDRLDAAGI